MLTTMSTNGTKLGDSQPKTKLVAIIAGILLTLLITSFIVVCSLLLWYHKRRSSKLKIPVDYPSKEEDASYAILEREMKPSKQQEAHTEFYDQIHLSPSTGQTELISKTESETAMDISTPISDIYSSIENSQPVPTSETEMSKLPQDATYAVVDKKKKSRAASEKNDPTDMEKIVTEKEKDQVKVQDQLSLEEMYAVVYKKPKKSEEQEEIAPSIPAYTVESLYTAVQKKPI